MGRRRLRYNGLDIMSHVKKVKKENLNLRIGNTGVK